MREREITPGVIGAFALFILIGYLLTEVGFKELSAREAAAFIGLPVTLVTVFATVAVSKSKAPAKDHSPGFSVLVGGLLLIGWVITLLLTVPAIFAIVRLALGD